MSKSLQDYLPNRSRNTTICSGRVPIDVFNEVKKIMEKENLSWADVLTACLRHFLDEKGPKKVR